MPILQYKRPDVRCGKQTTVYCRDRSVPLYTEHELKNLYNIFLTYKSRGGVLFWDIFALIPLTGNAGDISREHTTWTKYVRELLAERGRNILI